MSENLGVEDFEKIDPIQADQDENVTSTSLTGVSGDMAEEDRYVADRPAPPASDADLLADFMSAPPAIVTESVPELAEEPLMGFDSPVPSAPLPPVMTETSQPTKPSQPVSVTSEQTCSKDCWMKNVDPRVLELIYWRDMKKTGIVFGSMMFILLSLTFFTIMSVLAYLSLAILTVTLSFRIYKSVMQTVQKTNEGHPFKNLLAVDLELRSEVVQHAAVKISANINNLSSELRRLFLVEDYLNSLKFGLLLWFLTYVGGCFNGMTLINLAVVAIFTLPKVYDVYQVPIDQNVNLVRAQLNNIMKQVSDKIPFPKKKQKTQ